MGRASLRDKILLEGLRVVHERGYGGASVRDIVQASGVPHGSFTNHFPSKEAFGLAVLDLYFSHARAMIAETLLDDARAPLERLGAYVDAARDQVVASDLRSGCLLGNFSAEVVDQSEALRVRLVAIFAEIGRALEHCLDAARRAGDIPEDSDTTALALLITSSLQGAILIAKVQRDVAPVDNFKRILFARLLR